MSETFSLELEMNQYVCMVVHIIILISCFERNGLIDNVNEDKNKVKEQLVTLKLIYTQKIAQTQN